MFFFIFTLLVAALLYARAVPALVHFSNRLARSRLAMSLFIVIKSPRIARWIKLFHFWDAIRRQQSLGAD